MLKLKVPETLKKSKNKKVKICLVFLNNQLNITGLKLILINE